MFQAQARTLSTVLIYKFQAQARTLSRVSSRNYVTSKTLSFTYAEALRVITRLLRLRKKV